MEMDLRRNGIMNYEATNGASRYHDEDSICGVDSLHTVTIVPEWLATMHEHQRLAY
jgi:hypothetical protein